MKNMPSAKGHKTEIKQFSLSYLIVVGVSPLSLRRENLRFSLRPNCLATLFFSQAVG